MKQSFLSVRFIDDNTNRTWTYDNVVKLETGIDSVFIVLVEDDKKHFFSVLNAEYTRIEIEVQDDIL